jgi:hypothetical protein
LFFLFCLTNANPGFAFPFHPQTAPGFVVVAWFAAYFSPQVGEWAAPSSSSQPCSGASCPVGVFPQSGHHHELATTSVEVSSPAAAVALEEVSSPDPLPPAPPPPDPMPDAPSPSPSAGRDSGGEDNNSFPFPFEFKWLHELFNQVQAQFESIRAFVKGF